jgi:hypothetical protein
MKKISAVIFAVITILLVSSLSLAVESAAAQSNQATNVSNRPVEKSWIRINGAINSWGTTPVKGTLQTIARTALLESQDTRQLTSAGAIWTTNNSHPIQAIKAKENFTYTFYAARLGNASVSTLSASNSSEDYFLNGTWNLFTVQSTITVITNSSGNIVKVLRNSQTTPTKAYGELTVTDNWTKFTLVINGIDPLTGSVFRSVQRQVQFNPFKITDDSVVSTVTRDDFVQIMQCFRAMPGWGNYDTSMDFNNNFRVDIADLSTVASNM